MLKQRIRISIVTTPGQVRTIDVTHGGAANEEFTVRSLSIRQWYCAGLVQRTLCLQPPSTSARLRPNLPMTNPTFPVNRSSGTPYPMNPQFWDTASLSRIPLAHPVQVQSVRIYSAGIQTDRLTGSPQGVCKVAICNARYHSCNIRGQLYYIVMQRREFLAQTPKCQDLSFLT